MYTGPEFRKGTQIQSPGAVHRESGQGHDLVTLSIALANVGASWRWPRMTCDMSGHWYRVTAVEWCVVWRRCTKWNVVHIGLHPESFHNFGPASNICVRCYRDETFAQKSLCIGSDIQYNIYTHVHVYNICPKGTGAKLYSRPRTLVSTGAKVPVASVESAPMSLNAQ